MYIYIYTYVYVYVCMYIYIYISCMALCGLICFDDYSSVLIVGNSMRTAVKVIYALDIDIDIYL